MTALLRRLCWRVVFSLTGGFTVEGQWPRGACVIVANHSSHADAPALVAALPAHTRPAVAAAADYWFRGPLRRRLCRLAVGGFAVRRGGGGSADLASASDLLRAGRSVVVFAEGTRSRTGELAPFHCGAVRLAAAAGVPVVPVALIGTRELLPVHGRPRRAAVTVRVGTPMQHPAADDVRAAVVSLLSEPAALPDSRIRRRVVAFASSPAALLLVFAWAIAEAVSWPIVPEFLLGLIALARVDWRRLALLTATAVAGTVVGSAITFFAACTDATPPAPLTTPRMHVVAAAQLHDEGVLAVRHQLWSGIPVKVYSAAEGRGGTRLASYEAAVGVFRGWRMLIVAVVLGGISRVIPRRGYVPVASFAAATFAAGLQQVVQHWS